MKSDGQPPRETRVTIDNRQEAVELTGADLARWRSVGEAALALIDEEGLGKTVIPGRVGVFLVDDEAIAQLHREYLQDPTPTDVITFPLGAEGEVVVSVETARRQAADYGNDLQREACLYIVHGLLHLCGYEDSSAEGSAEMEALQERLLRQAEERGAGAPGRRDSAH